MNITIITLNSTTLIPRRTSLGQFGLTSIIATGIPRGLELSISWIVRRESAYSQSPASEAAISGAAFK